MAAPAAATNATTAVVTNKLVLFISFSYGFWRFAATCRRNHAWLRAFGRRSIVIDLARERARHQVGFEDSTSSPLLTVVPVINIPPSLILCETVPLLNLAFELLSTAIYHVEIVVGELSPLFLDPAFNLLPISFDSIPVHLDLRRSAHD